MSSRIKRYFAVLLVALTLFVSQVACFEEGNSPAPKPRTTVISTNTGKQWRRCASLSCTLKKDGDIRTVLRGSRIEIGTATPLGGKWE